MNVLNVNISKSFSACCLFRRCSINDFASSADFKCLNFLKQIGSFFFISSSDCVGTEINNFTLYKTLNKCKNAHIISPVFM